MISDGQTNIVFLSGRLLTDKRFSITANQLFEKLDSYGIMKKIIPGTKDIWARDYMPIQVTKDKFIEYRYDPDYLQGTGKNEREIKTYPDIVCDSIDIKTVKTDIILDGGNIVKSENAVILTDKIVQENLRSYNRNELIQQLENLFETDKIVLIPWDKEEKYGHADGMLRFIDNDMVLINWIYKSGDPNFTNRLLKPLREKGIKWVFLDFKVKKNIKYNWAFINFLQTKDIIIVPKFGISEDDEALRGIMEFYPSYAERNKIVQVDSKQVADKDGALNCISWTIMR